MIKIEDVSKSYTLGKVEVPALRNLSLHIESGKFVSVIGPSGSGKSTLLHLIGCLDSPTKGSIFINGENVSNLKKSQLAKIRSKKIGFIFQSFNLVPVLNVYENVELPLAFSGKKKSRTDILQLIDAVGLSDHVAHKPDELSGGQRQRVAIARALVTDPLIVLADEPTANLDSETAQRIIQLMLSMNREYKTTFLFSTHDPDVVVHANTVFRLKDGHLLTIPS